MTVAWLCGAKYAGHMQPMQPVYVAFYVQCQLFPFTVVFTYMPVRLFSRPFFFPASSAAGRSTSCRDSETVRVWQLPLLSAMLVVMLSATVLTGCKTTPQQQSRTGTNAQGDVVTASDTTALDRRSQIRLELATGYYGRKQYTVALDEVKQILMYQPDNLGALNLRGLIYMAMEEDALAEQSFRSALAVYADDTDALQNYGWFLCSKKRFSQAYQQFDAASRSRNYLSRAKAHLTKGICQAQAGNLPGAQTSLQESYRIDPKNPVAAYNLANVAYRRGEYQTTRRYIQKLNSSRYANAESLWLALRTEHKLNNPQGVKELGLQLRNRFPSAEQTIAFERGEFDD